MVVSLPSLLAGRDSEDWSVAPMRCFQLLRESEDQEKNVKSDLAGDLQQRFVQSASSSWPCCSRP